MSFIQVTKEEFNTHAQQVSERSFMQTEEMAKLLEKRGFSISYVAWKEGDQLEVSAIVYSMPMTGGLRMEVNCGPIHSNTAHLSDFYPVSYTHLLPLPRLLTIMHVKQVFSKRRIRTLRGQIIEKAYQQLSRS